MPRPPSAFGQVVLARLEMCKMSRADVLDLMANQGHKVSRKTLSAWIVGRRRPRYEDLVALADALAIPTEERGRLLELVAA